MAETEVAGPTLGLEMRGIVKRFGEQAANDGVDLHVLPGEIHALIGENGAGKTTLMSILFGLIQADAGTIRLEGRQVRFHSPSEAMAAGVAMVHQSFKLFPSLSVAANVVFGKEPRHHGLIDNVAANARVAELSARFGLQVDPTRRVSELPVGVCQRVEILKALHREARYLVLDEPTAVLTPGETDSLFDVLRELVVAGMTIILVTHKLREVMAVSRSATVLRDGRTVARLHTADTSAGEITRFMTGREALPAPNRRQQEPGETILQVEDLSVRGHDGRLACRDIDLAVKAGEVVGIAGVAGNGQSELIEAITGLSVVAAGRVLLAGADITVAPVARRREVGMAYVPEDRTNVGTCAPALVRDNLAMGRHRRPPLARHGVVVPTAVREYAVKLIGLFDIRPGDPEVACGSLSGGNLQKVALARELDPRARLLVIEQPTRGLDVSATRAVHQHLLAFRNAGGAVLLVSSELTEILAISDRILVMFDGAIAADLPATMATEHDLGLFMVGSAPDLAVMT